MWKELKFKKKKKLHKGETFLIFLSSSLYRATLGTCPAPPCDVGWRTKHSAPGRGAACRAEQEVCICRALLDLALLALFSLLSIMFVTKCAALSGGNEF